MTQDERTTSPSAVGASVALALAAVAGLAVSVVAPMATLVIGVILFGVLHNVLELRYLIGRFPGLLGRSFVERLGLLVTGIFVARLLAPVVGRPAHVAEVALGYAVLALGAAHVLQGRRRVAVLVALAPAAVASLLFPEHHVVAVALLHLVVPVVFLWDWSTRLPERRGLFRAVQVVWSVVVPAAVLAGLADPWLTRGAGAVRSLVGDGDWMLASLAPPGAGQGVVALRFLVVFAFLGLMQYVVWVAFLPRVAPEVTATFEVRLPWLTGARVWAAAFIAAAVFAVLFALDFRDTETLYRAVSSFSAYLEVPVLLALLVGGGRSPRPVPYAAGSAAAAGAPPLPHREPAS
ncbi:hypothetical protein N865_21310 [Intrasporangium oryzae NRRL B-24470]|uniref:Uncharacterized protein n=1 Tax=Intrasporangium oryzae NRRL B-24470 TaxID=1386089 RepID=W9G788_9MICO|nr:hypothetical protein [Intrasporangium oryzae]EWT00688.1 hypothetical protein N865_21310 [Intrasporangium oryzae NRRL B-24470]